MRLFVYDMLVNVNVIYYVHVCQQAHWARSAGNSAIENVCIIIIITRKKTKQTTLLMAIGYQPSACWEFIVKKPEERMQTRLLKLLWLRVQTRTFNAR